MTTQMIIDADSHVTEPKDTWTARVPQRFVDDVPHVERTADGRDTWVLQGEQIGTMGVTAPAGWPSSRPSTRRPSTTACPRAYDAAARLRYLDEAGIWAQVLYPNVGGFGSEHFLALEDAELKLLCVAAYNDFLLEWASADPARLLPDRRHAVLGRRRDRRARSSRARRARCARRAVHRRAAALRPARTIGDPHWDPLWDVAQEAGLPIHFHIGNAGDTARALDAGRGYAAHGVDGRARRTRPSTCS